MNLFYIKNNYNIVKIIVTFKVKTYSHGYMYIITGSYNRII